MLLINYDVTVQVRVERDQVDGEETGGVPRTHRVHTVRAVRGQAAHLHQHCQGAP